MSAILWARHGQNRVNLTRTLSYRVVDLDLTAAGRDQARDLAARLAARPEVPVGRIVTSPLRRAAQTAEIVSAALRLPVSAALDDLRELNVGDLDGRSDSRAWARYDAVLHAWRRGDYAARFPGGEDCRELCARIRRALTAASRGLPPDRAALVLAHGGSLRAALPMLAGCPDPGTDLATGDYATLLAGRPPSVLRLTDWPRAG
jgi:broad specificity phosphatase PhoE